MKEYEDAGIDRDDALAQAIDDVSAELGTTKDDLLTQLGKTEENIREDFETRFEGVETQVSELETTILDRMKEYEDAGIDRDDALAQAINDVSDDLGTTKDDLLTQLGKTEEDIREDFKARFEGVETQVSELETNILEKLQENEAAGIDRDEALSKAIADVSAELGTTEENLLNALGTTEENLLTRFDEGLADLGLDIETVANFVGKPAREVTDSDIDFVASIIAEQEVLADPTSFVPTDQQLQYDVNNDGLIDINDQIMLEQSLAGQDVVFDPDSQFAATGLYAYNDEIARQQREQETKRQTDLFTKIDEDRNKANAQALYRDILGASDLEGRTVTSTPAAPARIDYLYDISGDSIFATPQQEQLFASPYGRRAVQQPTQQPVQPTRLAAAKGGLLRRNDELLRLLGED
jgi:hypothetical protein